MEHRITIKKNTSAEDIHKYWVAENDDKLIFEISSDSSFQDFASGFAIGVLRDFKLSNVTIEVELWSCLEIDSVLQGNIVSNSNHLMATIFGLQLIFISISVRIKEDDKQENIRSLFGRNLSKYLKAFDDRIGAGSAIYLISNHLRLIPRILGTQKDSSKFVEYIDFKSNFSALIESMRKDSFETSRGLSKSEADIVRWAFHTAENAFDHATYIVDPDNKQNTKTFVDGFRGIEIKKKYVHSISSLEERQDLPVILKNYISERIEEKNNSNRILIQYISIIDIGQSIYNTLPPLSEDEDDLARFNRAFKDKETRKNVNEFEKAGFGLGDMIRSARALKALLHIYCGSYEFYYDFSDEAPALDSDSSKINFTKINTFSKQSGTSISIIWPEYGLVADQSELL